MSALRSLMKELVYPAGLVLIPLAHTTYIQAPKLENLQQTLDAHTLILAAHTRTLAEHSEKLNILVRSQEISELRQESLEKAYLTLEQRMAERKNMRQKTQQKL